MMIRCTFCRYMERLGLEFGEGAPLADCGLNDTRVDEYAAAQCADFAPAPGPANFDAAPDDPAPAPVVDAVTARFTALTQRLLGAVAVIVETDAAGRVVNRDVRVCDLTRAADALAGLCALVEELTAPGAVDTRGE